MAKDPRNERALLDAAGSGDEQAFVALTAPHRGALQFHCYRLLGSLHDADDALQETMLRAWRGLGAFEPRAPLVAWLHRIATNVSLRMIERRRRDAAVEADSHLGPYPDRLLEELEAPGSGPADHAITQEDIGLAFVAAMQLLPAKQRAVVVLRDALDWPAKDVAELLDESVAAVNSALQRGRDRLARERGEGRLARIHAPAGQGAEARVMRLFQEAWANVDISRIVSLLSDDALLTMPPLGMRFEGAAAIGEFFATEPIRGRLDRITLVETRANGQPALASYADEAGDGVRRAYGVMVLAIEGERIRGITGFPRDAELFGQLGLPLVWPRG